MKNRIDEIGNLNAGENWQLVRDILKDIYEKIEPKETKEEKKKKK